MDTDKVIFYSWLRPLARKLCGTLSPNAVTTIGIIPALLTVFAAMHRRFDLATVAFFIRYAFDCLDGAVARECNQCSKFGNDYDGAVDVIFMLLLGLAWARTYAPGHRSAYILAPAMLYGICYLIGKYAYDDQFLLQVTLLAFAFSMGERSRAGSCST